MALNNADLSYPAGKRHVYWVLKRHFSHVKGLSTEK